MLTHSSSRLLVSLACAFIGYAMSLEAAAKCGCPSDGNGAPQASTGLGQSSPDATDLALDPAWQVYAFERDGIRYTQINDQNGTVRAAVGQIGGTFWVMPIGTDADRVAVPGDATPTGQAHVLTRAGDVEVVMYQDGNRQHWLIRSPSVSE